MSKSGLAEGDGEELRIVTHAAPPQPGSHAQAPPQQSPHSEQFRPEVQLPVEVPPAPPPFFLVSLLLCPFERTGGPARPRQPALR